MRNARPAKLSGALQRTGQRVLSIHICRAIISAARHRGSWRSRWRVSLRSGEVPPLPDALLLPHVWPPSPGLKATANIRPSCPRSGEADSPDAPNRGAERCHPKPCHHPLTIVADCNGEDASFAMEDSGVIRWVGARKIP